MTTSHTTTTAADHGPFLVLRDLTICGRSYVLEIVNRGDRLLLNFHEAANYREGPHGPNGPAETDGTPDFLIKIWEGVESTVEAAGRMSPYDDFSRGLVTFERTRYRAGHDHDYFEQAYVWRVDTSAMALAGRLNWLRWRPDGYDGLTEMVVAFGAARSEER